MLLVAAACSGAMPEPTVRSRTTPTVTLWLAPTSTPRPTSVSTPTFTPTAAPTPEATVTQILPLPSSIAVGNLDLTVFKVETATKSVSLTPGATTFRVLVQAANNRGIPSREVGFFASQFEVGDANGVTYDAVRSCYSGCSSQISREYIPDGRSLTGYLYFDIPGGRQPVELIYDPPEARKVRVDLSELTASEGDVPTYLPVKPLSGLQPRLGEKVQLGVFDVTVLDHGPPVTTIYSGIFDVQNYPVRVLIENVRGNRTEDAQLSVGWEFELVGQSGLSYDPPLSCEGCPEHLSEVEIPRGRQVEGLLYFEVPERDGPPEIERMVELRYSPAFSDEFTRIWLSEPLESMPAATPRPTPAPTSAPTLGLTPTLTPTAASTPTSTPTLGPTPTFTPTAVPTLGPTATQTSPPSSISAMVQRVRPAVVRIRNSLVSGSGVIFETLDRTAFVITNHHVVEGATQVEVVVNDGSTYTGTVLGTDDVRDLAVVSICCGSFLALPFGDASELNPGDEVVAIGYALGIDGAATVTKGIVSAIRYLPRYSIDAIQTDAAINPGNSGGPMLSLAGEILGINTFKVAEAGVEGLGFAVSEATVQEQLPVLRAKHAAATPTAAPSANGPRTSFGPGVWIVGVDIAPGLYRSAKGSGCYWERLSGFSGTFGDIIANDRLSDAASAIVEIEPTDAGFNANENCGQWSLTAAPSANGPRTSFGPGVWIVGVDIAPGLYRSAKGSGCYWERLSGFSGTFGDIIANDRLSYAAGAVVEIYPTDAGFNANGNCGQWSLIVASAVATPAPQTPENSRNNPVPVGSTGTITIDTKTFELEVVSLFRGPSAYIRLYAARESNALPKPGYEWILFKLGIRYMSEPSDKIADVDRYDLDIFSAAGSKYVTEPDPDFDFDFFPGAYAEGWQAWQVSILDEHPVLLFGADYNHEGGLWLALSEAAGGTPTPAATPSPDATPGPSSTDETSVGSQIINISGTGNGEWVGEFTEGSYQLIVNEREPGIPSFALQNCGNPGTVRRFRNGEILHVGDKPSDCPVGESLIVGINALEEFQWDAQIVPIQTMPIESHISEQSRKSGSGSDVWVVDFPRGSYKLLLAKSEEDPDEFPFRIHGCSATLRSGEILYVGYIESHCYPGRAAIEIRQEPSVKWLVVITPQ